MNGAQNIAGGANAHSADAEDLALELLLTAGNNHALLLHAAPELVVCDARRHLHGGYSVRVVGVLVDAREQLDAKGRQAVLAIS